jgi:hypothetical protein
MGEDLIDLFILAPCAQWTASIRSGGSIRAGELRDRLTVIGKLL